MSATNVMPLHPRDEAARTAEFADRIAGFIDRGAIAVMISVGHRAGLFESLAAAGCATSGEIARRAGLHERYVREWLAVMTMAGIVLYDPAAHTYTFPAEHAASLGRGASAGNLAVYAQHIALLGQMQDALLERMRTGEGLRYEDYPCFHEMMEEDSAQTVAARLFDTILPLVPGLDARLERGIEVLDAGCGRGLALIELARRFPRSRFTGYDLCADAIESGRQRAAGLGNLRLERRDMSHFEERERYEWITSFDAVHDQRDPSALVRSLHDALRPGGVYLLQDVGGSARLEQNFDFPMAAFLYSISFAHCMPVSLGQGGAGLGTMWGWETAERTLREAGFDDVRRHVLPHDPMNVWFVATRRDA